jgi:hypothetical protein
MEATRQGRLHSEPCPPKATLSRPPEQLDFVLSELRKALDAQWDSWKHLEIRLQFLLGWVVAGAGVSVALGLGKSAPNVWSRILIVDAGAAALFTLGALVLAYWPRPFYRPPSPSGLVDNYLLEDLSKTKLMLVDTMAYAYDLNQEVLERRETLLRYAIFLAAGSGAMALLGLGLTTLGVR